MAESETRLETLEDEVKVLKGEVKRTLVDLRALLMREDSPLADGAVARRAATPEQVTAEGTGEFSRPEGLGIATPPAGGPAVAETPGPRSPQESGAPPAEPAIETTSGPPSGDFPGGPPQPGPGPAPVTAGFPGSSPESQAEPQDHSQAAPTPGNSESAQQPDGLSDNHTKERSGEGTPPEQSGPELHSYTGNGRGHLNNVEGDRGPENPRNNRKAGSVYDEYRELLEETRQRHALEDTPEGPPLDINLLSNLVYWTARAKQRVGDAQLKEILQLYIQSGHSRPELQDLMLQISDMVDSEPAYQAENPREWVELIFHLHGILTGGFPVIKLPRIQLRDRDNPQRNRD